MRAQKWKIAAIVGAVVAGGAACAWADVAATVDPTVGGFTEAFELSSSPGSNSVGWRFYVDQEITITHLGLYDAGDNGLSSNHVMGIWRIKKEGGLRLERWIELPAGGVPENHYVYVALSSPLTIVPDPVAGAGGFERWLVGVWSPVGSADMRVVRPRTAGALPIQVAGIIRTSDFFYTWKYWDAYPDFAYTEIGPVPPNQITAPQNWLPWGGAALATSTTDHLGINFKYTRPGPQAEAGPAVSIYTSEQALTLIAGVGGHTYPTTPIQYRWLEGTTVLQDWQNVGLLGTASLSLAAPVPALAIGAHTLTLEVTDGGRTASDSMVLTLDNTPPAAAPVTGHVLEIGADAILIQGSVADFDGDTVTYKWLKDGQELESGSLATQAGGAEVPLPDLVIPAGDPRFPLGVNQIQLEVSDGVNPAESATATVKMIDTTAPTVTPTANALMLWPPNHQLIPITIQVNCQDNGGGTLHLTANVTCSEDDGATDPDWYVDDDGNPSGTIALRLRAERSGTSEGRVYSIAITATDTSNNQSSVATVEIRVPHDKRKK